MKKSSSHGSYQKCFPPLTAIEVGFWETRMQGKVAANKDFFIKSSLIESDFNAMFENNAMFKPCWGIIILLLVKSVKLGQLFPVGKIKEMF